MKHGMHANNACLDPLSQSQQTDELRPAPGNCTAVPPGEKATNSHLPDSGEILHVEVIPLKTHNDAFLCMHRETNRKLIILNTDWTWACDTSYSYGVCVQGIISRPPLAAAHPTGCGRGALRRSWQPAPSI